MINKIDKFEGQYSFLSNFYEVPVTYEGITYQNSEAAFQAQKCPERACEFENLDPSSAKRLGRKVSLRSDWEAVKYNVMWQIVYAKFSQNPILTQKLIDTYPATLIEGNWWKDTYWGVCNGVGSNKLGIILSDIRDIFITGQTIDKIKDQENS